MKKNIFQSFEKECFDEKKHKMEGIKRQQNDTPFFIWDKDVLVRKHVSFACFFFVLTIVLSIFDEEAGRHLRGFHEVANFGEARNTMSCGLKPPQQTSTLEK